MTTETTAVAIKTIKPIEEIRQTFDRMTTQFRMALPAHIPVEKFRRVAETAVQNTPDLLSADRQSLYSSCMKAAQDGLLPDGRESAIVVFNAKQKDGTYKKTAQFMPMLSGILKKVRNSGELATIHAAVVYQNDKFDYYVDSEGQHIEHRPVLFGEKGNPIGVYAFAKTKDGSIYVEVLSIEEVNKIRAVSRSADSGPWKSWWDEMAKKSAIRRLAKKLPQSTDLDSVLDADKELFMPADPQTVVDNTTGEVTEAIEPPKKRKTRLEAVKEAAVEVKQEPVSEEPPPYVPGADMDEDVI